MNLTSPSELKRLLQEHGVAPHKAYGQHFLIDDGVLASIVDASDIGKNDTVLEVGPGLGVLTRELVTRAKHVVAFEVDRGFVRFLNETLSADNLTLVHADFLSADLGIEELLEPFKLVANLPYNITANAIMRVLQSGLDWQSMTLLVQLEAADRLRAKPRTKAYGALSVQVQLRCEVSLVRRVPPCCFFPPPRVESAVIRLLRKPSGAQIGPVDALVRAGFAMRRKTLANNLSSVCGSRENAIALIDGAGLSASVRAEELTPEDFITLANDAKKSMPQSSIQFIP